MTEPSRRDFLKVVGAGVVAAAAGVWGLDRLSASERSKKPDFEDVIGNSTLPLKIEGVEQSSKIAINYYVGGGVPVETMSVRVPGILPFENGAQTLRVPGEVLGNNLVRVKRSSLYPEGQINLHKSPATMGPIDTDMVLTDDEGLYGLSVITAVEYVVKGGDFSMEKNDNRSTKPTEFSKGWAVGKIIEANGIKGFNVLGYVCDGRILEAVIQ